MVYQENITYNATVKDLPSKELHRLFKLVGWSDGTEFSDMINGFNLPFINSTLVISAWGNDRLIGVVRVISDKIIRSVIHDLIVDPEYQGKGIGKELVKRCIEQFPNTEWLIQTTTNVAGFYEKIGFKKYEKEVLVIPSKWETE
jgi:ribosomal protein S18 acetylase RimI-like enzyme